MRWLAGLAAAGGFVYGEVAALRLFFDVQTCAGTTCHWTLADWPVPLVIAGFLVYLPFSPLVSLYFGWPAYLAAAFLEWVGRSWEARRCAST